MILRSWIEAESLNSDSVEARPRPREAAKGTQKPACYPKNNRWISLAPGPKHAVYRASRPHVPSIKIVNLSDGEHGRAAGDAEATGSARGRDGTENPSPHYHSPD